MNFNSQLKLVLYYIYSLRLIYLEKIQINNFFLFEAAILSFKSFIIRFYTFQVDIVSFEYKQIRSNTGIKHFEISLNDFTIICGLLGPFFSMKTRIDGLAQLQPFKFDVCLQNYSKYYFELQCCYNN